VLCGRPGPAQSESGGEPQSDEQPGSTIGAWQWLAR